MSSYLVTGGCGFIGGNLAVALAQAGHRVTCLDNFSRRGSELIRTRVLEAGCTVRHGDVRVAADLQSVAGDFEVLIECSAEPSVMAAAQGTAARYVIDTNLAGAVNCLELARERGMGVLFLSTSRVYPYGEINRRHFREDATRFVHDDTLPGITARGVGTDFPLAGPRTLYGATKLAAELLLQEYGTQYGVRTLVDRAGVVAGPWQMARADQGIFTFLLARHFFSRPFDYIGFGGMGKQVRDLLHVDDLTALLLRQLASAGEWRGEVFNVGGSAVNLSLCEAAALCREVTGNTVRIGSEPATRAGDVIWYVSDNIAAEERFGWRPQRDARTILADTCEWLSRHEAQVAPILTGTP